MCMRGGRREWERGVTPVVGGNVGLYVEHGGAIHEVNSPQPHHATTHALQCGDGDADGVGTVRGATGKHTHLVSE